jgi:ABC-type lipoprotein export system ATPase subunit
MILIALRQIAADTGATILMISHDPAIAAEADQVLRIEAGRLAHA